MSGMTSERLASIRLRLGNARFHLGESDRLVEERSKAYRIPLSGTILDDTADLLALVDHLTAENARTRYVVFDADWCEPPGDVIATFATKAEAWAHIRGPGDGYGWSIVEVPAPAVEP